MGTPVRYDAAKTAIGAVDGVNTVYLTPTPFVANTLIVWLGGLRVQPGNEDGYTENAPTGFTMAEPPFDGTTVQVWYQEA